MSTKTYISPRARVLPFCPESALLQSSTTIPVDEDEDVNGSDKSNRRTNLWDFMQQ